MNGDFGAYLKAAETDPRADGNQELFGSGVELACHGFHSLGRDFANNSAPSCVNSGNGSISGVGDQDRQAIGSSDGEPDPRLIANQRIAFSLRSARLDAQHMVGMHLPGGSQPVLAWPSIAKARAETVLEPVQVRQRIRSKHAIAATPEQISL